VVHLHFDCFSGISGDMILGALVDAGLPLADLARGLKAIRLDGYRLRARAVTRSGVHATKADVVIGSGVGAPYSLTRIHRLIDASRLPAPVKTRSRAVFARLARAEGLAHRVPAADVRFHEVGVVDSIVDVVGSILGCHLLGADRITASSVNLGAGVIRSAHGTLPVPGPAVAALARGIPVHSQGPARELTTPTGLAILCELAQEFGALPLMRPTAVGYGAGTADPDGWPNVLRLFRGTSSAGLPIVSEDSESIVQLETNVDDLSPQAYDSVVARLFAAGAVDVTLTPVIMKQGRPGIVLTVLAPRDLVQPVADALFRETPTLGIRLSETRRLVLPRRMESVRLHGGTVRIKIAASGPAHRKAAPEYQDCKRLAERTGRPVREILEDALLAWRQQAARVSRPVRHPSPVTRRLSRSRTREAVS
jgi:uncharacterized protein (TIGR00299 family) protein